MQIAEPNVQKLMKAILDFSQELQILFSKAIFTADIIQLLVFV